MSFTARTAYLCPSLWQQFLWQSWSMVNCRASSPKVESASHAGALHVTLVPCDSLPASSLRAVQSTSLHGPHAYISVGASQLVKIKGHMYYNLDHGLPMKRLLAELPCMQGCSETLEASQTILFLSHVCCAVNTSPLASQTSPPNQNLTSRPCKGGLLRTIRYMCPFPEMGLSLTLSLSLSALPRTKNARYLLIAQINQLNIRTFLTQLA